MIKTILQTFLFSLVVCSLFGPVFVYADLAGGGEPPAVGLMSSFPGLGSASPGIIPLLNAFFKILLSVAAILAVIFIAIGGFEIMSKDTPFYISEGKDRIQSAIIGLLIIMTSYIVLWTINPNLVSLDIFKNLEALKTEPGFVSPTGDAAGSQASVQGKTVCAGATGCDPSAISIAQCTAVRGCIVQTFSTGPISSTSCRCSTPEAATTPSPTPTSPTPPTGGPSPTPGIPGGQTDPGDTTPPTPGTPPTGNGGPGIPSAPGGVPGGI